MFVIGQCNRTVKGTLNTSCLCKWTERVMYCCLAFRRVTVAFFSFSLFNENLEPQPMSCFFFKFGTTTEPYWTPLGPIWLFMTNGVANFIIVLIVYVIFSGQLTPRRENIQYKAAVD